jgi:hypothetical protein
MLCNRLTRFEFFPAATRTALAVAFMFLIGAQSSASEGVASVAVRVEEDWELVLNEPSDAKTCPQFETVMSLTNDRGASYARVTWNYRESPEFHGAGLQLQSWFGDNELDYESVQENELSSFAETITWTQVLKVSGPTATFAVVNGQSDSWGTFGDATRTVVLLANEPNVDAYSTDVSAANCQISYGLNRVAQLRIKEVRRYDAAGAILSTDTTDRVLYSDTAVAEF